MATLFALLNARWASMKTRRLAIAAERGSVEERSAQAWGFVSRIIVRRDGGGSVGGTGSVSMRPWKVKVKAYHQRSCRNGLSRRRRSWLRCNRRRMLLRLVGRLLSSWAACESGPSAQ